MCENKKRDDALPGLGSRLRSTTSRLLRCESGANAIEYGLLASLIALGILTSMQTLGGGLKGSWDSTAKKVSDAMK